ncbi:MULTISPECIES: terminase large subunit [Pseudomonas]|uniref:terminase large subunit n=1 Tax=Pseudomonas TaxID=286 RepID=UPI000894604E|nr:MULTISPECIES: terminase large subunit [Pseudomonas]KAA8706060.1 terminase large subunit [Pseudomonas proteolytica]MBL7231079.1 terminase large subunit [Pseudomonas sp.]TWR83778.1 terminase large subunit [Pseudomonas proteolytica]SEE84774.1 Phage terminase-like protein, large subunit, contains N-terminal HTH domain [Pseudomonas proteolytica]
MNWATGCPDWEKRIVDQESIMPLSPIFQDQADEALDVFCNLRMVDADGSPLMGDTCRPWVLELVGVLFGSYDAEARRRLITNYFLMVSKKNGKSTIAAGIMLTALILNARPSGEFIILAPTKEAADNAYKPIRDMIKADDDLEARFHEQEHLRTITDRLNQATLKVVAADSATVTGKKAIGVFIDELHEFGKQAKSANMLTEATGGLASRPEGFVFYCTTQSASPPAGVFKAKLDYARGVRDGRIIDKRFLPIIYEFPRRMIEQGLHKDLANAYVTNPNWGVSVDQQVIEQKYQEAQEAGEESIRDFLAKHMNVEIGLALLSNRWPGAEFWEAQVRKCITLDYILERSEVVTIGVDGGGLDDLLGLAVLGRDRESRQWLAWCRAWAHPSVLERRKDIAANLNDYARSDDLVLVKHIGDDVDEVADIVDQVDASGLLHQVGLDPAGIGAILEAITARGVSQEKVVGVSQGWRLGGAIKTTERKLAEGGLIHADQPLMNWCCGNARVEPKGNSILITKQASGSAKIDPLMALFCAVSIMATNPKVEGTLSDHIMKHGLRTL